MLLLTHILIALSSLIMAGLAWLHPSSLRLRSSYVLVILTVASGTILTVQQQAHLLQACATGLAYLAIVFTAIIAARFKLIQD